MVFVCLMATIAIDLCIIILKHKLLNHWLIKVGCGFPISSWDPKLQDIFDFLKSHGKMLMTSATLASWPAVWCYLTLATKF